MLGLLLLSVPLFAQEPQPPPPPPAEHKGPPVPKNLKLLPPDNLIPTMMAFRVALGVECSFCHVKGDFASDADPHKDVARKMIVMAKEINVNFPDGKVHVTCYTCHRGATAPKTAPDTP